MGYGFSDGSVGYLDRFPNVERMTFWDNDYGSFESFPPLLNLRVLHHEACDGEFSLEVARRFAACRNLEEIIIDRPMPQEGVELLRALPNLEFLDVAGNVIIDKDKQSGSRPPAARSELNEGGEAPR